MGQPIEGLIDRRRKVDGRTREARATRAAPRNEVVRSDDIRPDSRPDAVREPEARATPEGAVRSTRPGAERPDRVRPGATRDDDRPDTVREAEARAAEIEDELGDYISTNELDLPSDLSPPGWVYELKADSVAGQENRHHMLGLLRTGVATLISCPLAGTVRLSSRA
jgi:hypothetical protein